MKNTQCCPPVVTCTLTDTDRISQAERWRQVRAAQVERTETDQGLRLVLERSPAVEDELASLVAVERECCAWASWNVSADASSLVLDVASSGDGIAVLHEMFRS